MADFMRADMTDKTWWYVVDGPEGTEWIPEFVAGRVNLADCEKGVIPEGLADYCENSKCYDRPDRTFGYGVRSSAPGYLDCTSWTVYSNKAEAQRAYRAEVRACKGLDD